MDKRYLWKRSNVYWVRVRVPDDVRDIIGKCQLSKNLYTKVFIAYIIFLIYKCVTANKCD